MTSVRSRAIIRDMRRQNKKYFEYRIVITPDVRIGSGERGFTALAPALGIATGGDSVEDALQNFEMQLQEEPAAVGSVERKAMNVSLKQLERALEILDVQHSKAERMLASGETGR